MARVQYVPAERQDAPVPPVALPPVLTEPLLAPLPALVVPAVLIAPPVVASPPELVVAALPAPPPDPVTSPPSPVPLSPLEVPPSPLVRVPPLPPESSSFVPHASHTIGASTSMPQVRTSGIVGR
jgi:hypothetical protein